MRVLVTGARGMLGTDLCARLRDEHKVIAWDLPEYDVTNLSQALAELTKLKPDVVVHCAANTNVDGCERDPQQAYLVNALGTWNIAAACAESDTALAYLSTDFVFDGEKGEPYDEFDIPNPISVYGRSKYAGELLVRQLLNRHYIVRSSWLFGMNGNNFVRAILRKAEEGGPIPVVADQVGCPTYTVDLAEKIAGIIESPQYGTYHVTNAGSCSWAEFAEEIIRQAGLDTPIVPIPAADWESPTRRPKDSRLRHLALELQGRDNLRSWQEALAEFLGELRVQGG